jgi:CubicO group peptidase (beta-lactamase class C family)
MDSRVYCFTLSLGEKTMGKKFSVLILMSITLCLSYAALSAGDMSTKRMVREIDEFIGDRIPANGPGASVLVVKEGNIILRKGYGMANLELGVPMRPEMVFRIGSITKQFTAAGILMLVEEGRVSLKDEITKYIPEYPNRGTKIRLHHLLNHTSGIKSYDDLHQFQANLKKDFKPDEFINIFKNKSLEFKPGEQFKYSNSGYFLLGLVIEKVSGKTYEKFVKDRIFEPLGMKNSYYDDFSRIISNRAAGYQKTKNGFINAEYFSQTWAYASGALLSTIDDLWTWTKELHSGQVISPKYLKLMLTPTKCKNGKVKNYGYGFWLNPLFGEKRVDHNGGIFGFLTYLLYLPKKDIFVSVLTNALVVADAPFMGQWIAALLCGKEVKRRKAVFIDTKTLDEIVGVYEIAKGLYRTITREGNRIYSQKTDSKKLEVFASSESEFFYKDSFSHFSIVRDKNGKVIKMVMHGQGPDEEAIKTDRKPKKQRKLDLDITVFTRYIGKYTSEEGIEILISLKEGKAYAQLKGQPEFEIFQESRTKFFFKVAEAHMIFITDTTGRVAGLELHQGGRSLKMKRKSGQQH